MKVYIVKFLGNENIEHNIRKFFTREDIDTARNVKVYCVEELIREKLELAGVKGEILWDFQQFTGISDEPSWDRVFEISDDLRSSIESNNQLKFSGINFLSMEYHIIKYVYAVKLANLLNQMRGHDYEVVILVLTAPYIDWLADINTPMIKTVKFGRAANSLTVTRFGYNLMIEAYAVLVYAKNFFQQLFIKYRKFAVRENSPKPPVVLFLVSYIVYARPAMAIVDACLKNNMIPYIATDDTTLLPLLRAHGTSYRVKPPLFISLFSLVFHLKKVLLLPNKLERHINSFYYGGNHSEVGPDEFSATNLCRTTLLAELRQLCIMAVSRILFLEKLIKAVSPDILCVMPQDHFLQKMGLALTRHQSNLPILACSAAWETSDSSSFRRHIRADRLAVMGEEIKRIYVESGLEPERISVTGAAHFDQLFNRNREYDEQVLLEHGINPEKKIIVFTTQPGTVGEIEELLVGIIEAVKKIESIQLVVKTHPDEGSIPYQTIVKRYVNPDIHVIKDINLYSLISCCELLVTKHSTTALEAMMIDKPVVTINLSGQPDPVPYAEEGVAIGAYRREDIEPAILEALNNEDTRSQLKAARKKFIRKWAGEPDGNASLRVVKLIEEMIGSKNPNYK
ncbi:UDP-N-acetylglucosamine 2-epimerase [Chloroflexota bacterium]